MKMHPEDQTTEPPEWTPEEREALDRLSAERGSADTDLEDAIVVELRRRGRLTGPRRDAPVDDAPARGSRRFIRADRILQAAAALIVFLGGVVAGQWLGFERSADLVSAVQAANEAERAVLLQRAGSEYVRTLASLGPSEGGDDSLAGEVARATLYAAASELARLRPDDAEVRRILEILGPQEPGRPTSEDLSATTTTIWF